MIFLENDFLKASFSSKGAELQSLIYKQNGVSYIWNGDANYWAKFSPVLFPIVGALKNNTYYFEEKVYELPRHGFARDHNFEAFLISDTEVVFKLSHNEETLKNYPFQFILQLRYTLKGSSLSCKYEVTNPSGNSSLYFSIGAHPAFAVPLTNNLQYTDYFLVFNNDQVLSSYKINDNLLTDETVEIDLKDSKLPLNHELFYGDALVFKSLKSDCISICSDKDTHGLHFKFKDFPFFGIWAAKNANFVCLEPWCGIADGITHQQDLKHKEGIIQLAPQQIWDRKWEITVF
ncbi:aldose 1-epimerase family protein [Pedobacter nyackensis]|uniref:aldose 1-epimerase family protein n=1 Tax=Pedobacter nyackensis TaxID=475255 RepID=UPI00292DCCD8|nr:aldose 1-epimerase family protein [Pedobacter nyackensis]